MIHGSQLMALAKTTDFDLVQKCISQNLTPYNDQGQPIRPVDVVIQHIGALEQELSRLDEAAWDLTGLEREKIIEKQIQPLEERLQNCRLYLHSIENLSWDGFELPQEHGLAVCFINGLANSSYCADDVDRLLLGHTETPEERRPSSDKTKSSRSVHSQECRKKCREMAKRIWDRQPDFTIAGMINRSEIIRQARQPDGSPYSEMTVRSWIRDLCPNRKPGRRAKTTSFDESVDPRVTPKPAFYKTQIFG